MEEQVVWEILSPKLDEVQKAVKSHLSSIQDHIHLTLQQASLKCAYECCDIRRKLEEVNNCTEDCLFPVVKAQQHFENEMAKFHDRLNRSIKVCMHKVKVFKLEQKTGKAYELGSCVDASIQESLNTLPHLANKLKASLNITS